MKKQHAISHLGIALVLSSALLLSCSQEKNTFINRSFHNVTSKYNGYFNAREKVRAGKEKLQSNHKEDYQELLPIYIYGSEQDAQGIYPEMDAAIEKCSRVIEMHSMEIRGKQYCKWIDDSYLVIGQAHFYKQEYDEAKRVFQYLTKEYKHDPVKYEALMWMARCYIQKESYYDAKRVLRELESDDHRIEKDVKTDYYLVTADFYIQQENYEMAIPYVKDAIAHEERKSFLKRDKQFVTRLMYILAQLYEKQGESYLAIGFFKEVIKRHPEYEMEFYAKINLATAFSTDAGGGEEIIAILTKMLKDDKNIEYYDQIYYALAMIYLKRGDEQQGIDALKMSVKTSKTNTRQKGLSFYKLAQISFDKLQYEEAQVYYDSTSTFLTSEHPDYENILKIRNSLNELVKNITIIQEEDSLQKLAKLPEEELERRIIEAIDKYEREEEERRRREEREESMAQNERSLYNEMPDDGNGKWYFYNPSAVSFGFSEFNRIWGNRKNEDDWRRNNKESKNSPFEDNNAVGEDAVAAAGDSTMVADKTSMEYYKQNIPFTEEELEVSNQKLKDAYYDLGVLYQEQLEDNIKAVEGFETLVTRFDSSDHHLITYYRLYRIFVEENNPSKANYYKDLILNNYPESDYAKLILNPDYLKEENQERKQVEAFYEKAFEYYQDGFYKACIMRCEESKEKFPDNHLKTKFMLLAARAKGNMGNREESIKDLNVLAGNHASTEDGKEAQEILNYMKKAKEKAEKEKEEQERLAKGYVYDGESKHTAVLIVPNQDMKIDDVKIAISNFNGQYFKLKDLQITAVFLDKEYQMVSVKDFENADKALQYYNSFKNNNTYLKKINEKNYDFFMISYDNYPIFYEKKNVGEYLQFFSKNYLEEAN